MSNVAILNIRVTVSGKLVLKLIYLTQIFYNIFRVRRSTEKITFYGLYFRTTFMQDVDLESCIKKLNHRILLISDYIKYIDFC